jgi:hypothetical protein
MLQPVPRIKGVTGHILVASSNHYPRYPYDVPASGNVNPPCADRNHPSRIEFLRLQSSACLGEFAM